ncbi:MAG: 2-oxoglutarate dehydrogenase E1 component [Leptolyngbya sp. PLA3]|nr:MAG: 2-oxoglutarate dehydrogenase E1 component [Cyanobacteria bacterium CYA]MCE7968183.1 2-oxoglutarate dehydrogenase E1 component [Leptolyngbya sp. PL-A3]
MSAGPKPVRTSINSWNAEYIEQQYRRFQADPASVEPDIRIFFQGFDLALAGQLKFAGAGAPTPVNGSHTPAAPTTPAPRPPVPYLVSAESPVQAGHPVGQVSRFQAVVDDLIEAYRGLGHLVARLDPFGRERTRPLPLQLSGHGLSEDDLDRPVDAAASGFPGAATLREVVDCLERTYCGSIGVEFMHIQDTSQRAWLVEHFERSAGRAELSRAEKSHILELLTRAEAFEKFLGKRYPGDKRFSLEGSESLIPLLDGILLTATQHEVEEVVLGMAHRGRLNVLNNIVGKSYQQIFTEFEETWVEDFDDGGGDVKYHRGYSGARRFPNGRVLHLAMASNPSHLESVDPVVLGRCRAKQRLRGDTQRKRVIPLLIHGDAAVPGQGMVAEVLNLSQLEGYRVGGTIHVVVNNHIGFTTSPEDARTSRYCTDIAKFIDAPVLHVNGEDPEACVAAARFALEYRQHFQRDIFIDLWCYRKYGHNEQDEQSFTQPILTRLIRQKRGVLDEYADRLLEEGAINKADIQAIQHRLDEALEQAQAAARQSPYDPTIDPGSARWIGLTHSYSFGPVETAVTREALAEVCAALGRVPEGFHVNRKLEPLLRARAGLLETGAISYADAEALAYGTLLIEGHPMRLTGQDVRRGTFSHRHAVIRDQETGEPYVPLNHIRRVCEAPALPEHPHEPVQAKFCIYDSPLSEQSVLGFDYGYSLGDPRMQVIWEAQFGDFANGAQVIIDQYIASAETKWDRWTGLIILLPHGYEGAGPEHSSARMERFLKLCGGDNMEVVYPTTAAQAFHMFRRGVKRNFRKPMIVMTPKSMLRVPTSHIDELMSGHFQEMLDDPMFACDGVDRAGVQRVIICCGKIFWELDERRRALGRRDIAIIRVEQVHPFHHAMFREILDRYPRSAERVYVQEEPRNAAAYLWVGDRMVAEMDLPRPRYIGRRVSGSPATGSKRMHKIEQERILSEAIGPKPEHEEAESSKAAVSV